MKYNILKSPIHGIGCFALKNIKKGELIMKEPYFEFTKEMIDKTKPIIGDYYWRICDKYLLVNGLGSYTNHSYNNNIIPSFCFNNNYVSFFAVKNIIEGEELFTNYGNEYWNIKMRKNNK